MPQTYITKQETQQRDRQSRQGSLDLLPLESRGAACSALAGWMNGLSEEEGCPAEEEKAEVTDISVEDDGLV